MKNIFKIFSFANLIEKISITTKRFLVSLIIILTVTVLFFVLLHWEFTKVVEDNIIRINISLIMTFFFSVWIYLNLENYKYNYLQKNLFQIIPLLFGIMFYYTFNSNIDSFENFVFFILTLLGIISYLFFAPYFKNISSTFLPLVLKGDVWKTEGLLKSRSIFYTYFYNISVVILTSFIFAGVVFWLWAIVITTVDILFDLNVQSKNTYWNWSILVLSFLSPVFALINIPNKSSFLKSDFKVNLFFSFLIKYISIIFISLYFLILYAYTVKVLFNFSDWPKWEVSWMVIWFSIFWYLAYIFSYIFEKENKFIDIFRKIFPYAVLFQIPMLFYAIYLRINQYDFTINRYFVVVFGLWLLVLSLYFVISKKKNLIFIPAVLTIFTMIISIWPWWVYSFPENRQLDRLENNLVKANILKNQKIIPLNNYSDISEDLSKNIYSWIDYLCDFDNCDKIKKLFPKIYNEILKDDKSIFEDRKKEDLNIVNKNKWKVNCKEQEFLDCYNEDYKKEIENRKYTEPNKWTIVKGITEKIKVKNYFSEHNIEEINIYWSYDNLFPLDLTWYSELIRLSSNKLIQNKKHFQVNIYDKNMELYNDWIIIEKVDLENMFNEIVKRYYDSNLNKIEWSQEDLTFVINEKYKIIFQTIRIPKSFKEIKKDDFLHYYISGVVLVK